jgi:hypothetical protein
MEQLAIRLSPQAGESLVIPLPLKPTNPANDAGLVIGYSYRATPDGVGFD